MLGRGEEPLKFWNKGTIILNYNFSHPKQGDLVFKSQFLKHLNNYKDYKGQK